MKTKQYLALFILFAASIQAPAQILRGTVYDAATRKPVPDAFVYLDGTVISTTTDVMGRFEIKPPGVINTQLIVHHLSYAPFTIPNPFQEIPEAIYLQEKSRQLTEAVVSADRFTRAQKMKAFKEQFLGTTKPGASCEILNEEDITISYDLQTQTLTAFSDNPIVVVNRFLGYKIHFTLVEFKTVFSGNKIDHAYARQSFYAITSSYEDLNPNNRTFQRRRNEVYEHSLAYFYKNLIQGSLEKASFRLFNNQNQINPYHYLEIEDAPPQKLIRIKSGTDIDRFAPGSVRMTLSSQTDSNPIFGAISVLYKRKIQSGIVFYTDQFFADEYGNTDAYDKILYTGHFGELRAGDLLPLDYTP